MSVAELADRILRHLARNYDEHDIAKFDTKSLAEYFETDHEELEQAVANLHENGHVELHVDGGGHITDKGIQSMS
ncbi:MAG: hypothetical protein K9J48_03615 [Desulfohalobiaceae bacterium]|nr:hypothetical protein [Desulfohalobiaceae bacterium]MCF8085963.1 hypothetical protein [Desulfohalobiaceae bacterium]